MLVFNSTCSGLKSKSIRSTNFLFLLLIFFRSFLLVTGVLHSSFSLSFSMSTSRVWIWLTGLLGVIPLLMKGSSTLKSTVLLVVVVFFSSFLSVPFPLKSMTWEAPFSVFPLPPGAVSPMGPVFCRLLFLQSGNILSLKMG
uniref:Uncharacterized protein n=1 Tax=Cacopsylla melanoneura TaxID=428564 RepID=A0A8D8TH10_9HEMI